MAPLELHIRDFRLAKGWTQAELAERAKVRTATISDMENGKVQRIDLPVLERLANALGVLPTALLKTVQPKRGG